MLKSALESLFATLVIVAMLELFAGAAGVPLDPSLPTAENCLRRSRLLGMEFAPNCTATWSDYLLSGDHQTTFHTNALGLRDDDVDGDAPVILSIGDSCTWGWQVAQADAYPQRLQKLLDERIGEKAYRVVNAGVPGYTSYQGLLYLRDRGLALRPRVVIVGYGFNDALANGNIEEDLARQQRMFGVIEADDFLQTHSSLWRWVRGRIQPTPPPNRPPRVPPAAYQRNLASIVSLTRAAGAKPLLLSFNGPPRDADLYSKAVAQVASELQVPTVVYDGPRLDAVHPTEAGYAALANTIFQRLQADGYVTATGDGRPAQHPAVRKPIAGLDRRDTVAVERVGDG